MEMIENGFYYMGYGVVSEYSFRYRISGCYSNNDIRNNLQDY